MRLAIVLALLTGLLLAACGSSSSSPPTTTARAPSGLTKPQFIARADPLCAAGKRQAQVSRILALAGQFPTPTGEISSLLRKAAQTVRQLVTQLSALAPPAADRPAIAQWIGQITQIGTLVTKAAGQVQGGDLIGAVKTEQDINVASVDPVTFAKAYGLADCSSIGS